MAEGSPTMPDHNEFSTAAMALEARPPARLARAVSATIVLFALAAIAYAALAHMDIVITAPGRVVPSGRTVLLQAPEPGVLRATRARDGQKVRAGDVLFELGASLNGAKPATPAAPAPQGEGARALLDARLLESLSKLATLDAEMTRRRAERDAVSGVIAQLRASMGLVGRKHAMRQELAKTGHMTETNLIESKLELLNLQKELMVQQNRLEEAEAALNAAIQQKTQAEAEYKARFPAELVQVAARTPAGQAAANGARANAAVRAPVDGIVYWLASSAAGAPVATAQNLLVIVPEDAALEVEALVLNKDIGHLKPGQHAVVKVETFDYTRYGHVDGSVQWVGADAVTDPKLGPVYAARVGLKAFETPAIVNGVRGRLSPGMNVTVDVRVAERRMIEYFLAPLLRYKEESLRER